MITRNLEVDSTDPHKTEQVVYGEASGVSFYIPNATGGAYDLELSLDGTNYISMELGIVHDSGDLFITVSDIVSNYIRLSSVNNMTGWIITNTIKERP